MQDVQTYFPRPGSRKKWALRSLTDNQIGQITKGLHKENNDENDKGEFILCRNCGNVITSTGNKIEMNGKHRHSFTNPRGFVFRIGCFAAAQGILNQGSPTLEFTWFPGFSWCFTLCARCFAHLGWAYRSGETHFYGLILDCLIQEDKIKL